MKEKKVGWWRRKTTGQKVSFCVAATIFAITVFLIVVLMDLRWFVSKELADKVYGENVKTGWHILGNKLANDVGSWTFTFIIIFISFVLIFISNFITHLFDDGSRKAKTISSLIRSLMKYVIIIAAVAFILVAWGVDVAGIIAGVGVITLIIGLGCQTLIQDVVSGLFIVFDDYFAAGDTVIIDGFRGTVVEVGLKTTKLQDFGGNIKSITNSSITTVVNMSRLRSVASVKLSVSYNEDVERVESLIVKEIESLKQKVPNIIDGPWYKGIDAITASSIDFLVIAFCDESNRFQVTRDLNREFYLLFKKNDVIIPYSQVTINPQDPIQRPKASEKDIETAINIQNELRGLVGKKPASKRSVKKIVKESFEKSKKEMEN